MISSKTLTQKEFYIFFILKTLSKNPESTLNMFSTMQALFPDKKSSTSYFYIAARQLEKEQHIKPTFSIDRTKFYEITDSGIALYQEYMKSYKSVFENLKKVADQFVYEITGTGKPSTVQPLSKNNRTFFSSIINVKDVVRYVILKEAMTHREIVISEIIELLNQRYGWSASKGWMYDIVRQMEENEVGGPLLIGRWENERRTKRFYQITARGEQVFNQIATEARKNVIHAQHLLNDMLQLFD